MHYLPLGDNIPDEPEQLIVGDPCPHCNSTLTDDVLTIWEDDDLRCLHNVCYWCGEGFETVKPKTEPPAPGDTDGIPF